MAFVLASAGAVTTNSVQNSKTDTLLINGWVQNPNQSNCMEVFDLDCTTTSGTPACRTSGATPKNVYSKVNGLCSAPLYQVIHP
jgi:hypothetical protein